jgi:Flp pilus assembly protein TadG
MCSFHRVDRGSTSLTTVLLTPVFVVIAFAAFQAAMWTHARTEARSVARDAAALVARSGESPAAVESSAEAALRSGADIQRPEVEITPQGQFVVVRVTGRAPGIIRGTSTPVDVTEAMPIEGFRP